MSPWLSDTLLRAQSDDRLVALARAGHERAFAAIAERYRRQLLAFARRLVPDQRAEDVVQQSLLAAWRALCGGAEVRHLRGWLHRIVRNTAVKTLAAAPAEEALTDRLVAPELVESEAERRAHMRATLAGVAALPERQRRALVGTAVEGRSRVEVAASLGLSEGAVRQLIHRARTTLRAAASAVTPTQLAQWAAQTGPGRPATGAAEHLGELAAGAAGSASAAGIALKAGAVIAVTGAVAAGVASGPAPKGRDGHAPPAGAAGLAGAPAGLLAGASIPGAGAATRFVGAHGRDSSGPGGGGASSGAPAGSVPISRPSRRGEGPAGVGPRRAEHDGAGALGGRHGEGDRSGRDGSDAPPRIVSGGGSGPGGPGTSGSQPGGGEGSQPQAESGDAGSGSEPSGGGGARETSGDGGGTGGDAGEARSAEHPSAPSTPSADATAPGDGTPG